MNRLLFCLCFAVAMAAPASVLGAGVEDILFRATFDETADAEIARGRVEPKAVNGPLAFEEGRYGQALVAGEEGTVVEYRIEGNLDVKQGSISFWFKPVDWEPSEKRSHVFLRFPFASLFRIFTDEAGQLVFEVGTDLAARCGVSASLAGLEKGAWTRVVATWSAEELRLYVNGELAGREPCDDRFLPPVLNYNFALGDIPRAKGREIPKKTLLDDVTVFRRPIEPAEFKRIDQRTGRGPALEYEPPVISVVKRSEPIVIDGRIGEEEWRQAAMFGSFLNVTDGKLASLQTRARTAWDNEKLYLAVESPILPGAPLKANGRNRDDHVWNDDAVQIYLAPPRGGIRFHFVCNSIGTVFDRKTIVGIKHDTTWDGQWELANRTEAGQWTLELAIPFSELELSPPADGEEWRLNVTRDRVQPQNLSCWPRLNAYSDVDNHGVLRFLASGPSIGVRRFGSTAPGEAIALELNIFDSAEDRAAPLTATLAASRSGSVFMQREFTAQARHGPQSIEIREPAGETAPDMIRLSVTDPSSGLEVFRQTVFPGETGALVVRCTPIPSRQICNVTVKESDPSVLEQQPTVEADLVKEGDLEPLLRVAFGEMSDGSASGQFALSDLPSGTYELRTRLISGSEVLDQSVTRFVKPDEPWRDLRVGESEEVPPPWTPLRSERMADGVVRIDCWNRTYFFDSPVPGAIRNGGVDQLAGPIRIVATVDGEELQWDSREISEFHRSDTEVRFRSSMQAGPLRGESETYVEYDGMMWTEITIVPTEPTRVEKLELVVPIDARYASLKHVPGDTPLTGNTGREDGWTWDYSARRFFLWIGNADLGLTWFYERPDQLRFADKEKFVRLERRDDVMYFKVRYVDQPVTLDEPLTLAFGLQATPVRSRPKGWRSWGEPRPIGTSFSIPWTTEHMDRYGAGYPEATSPEFYTRYVQFLKRHGKVTPYKVLLWHGIRSPEWQYNQADWDLGGGVNKYHDTRRHWWGGRVCGAANTFVDFITWKMCEHIEKHELDGVYHDLQWSYRCGNPNHGCDPTRRSIRGDRELNKRLYTAMKQLGRPLWKVDHASNHICSPYSAFGDIFTTGEEMRTDEKPAEPNTRVWGGYFDCMRLSYFKACGAMGRQWGVVPMFLLQMNAGGVKPHATEGIFSILLAHDAIPTWDALYKDVRFMHRLWRTLEAFGIGEDDVEFLPYWHETTPAAVNAFTPEGGGPVRPVQVLYEIEPHDRLREEESYGASVYRRFGARSIVVVFNYTEDDAIADVELDVDALGLDPEKAVVTDAFTRFRWTRATEPVRVRVKNRNFRLLWVENGDAADAAPAFPAEAEEVLVAGDRPLRPETSQTGTELAGDLWDRPWSPAPAPNRPANPERTEQAQIFTLAEPAAIHRVELNKAYSGVRGPELREAIRFRLETVNESGLPSGEVLVPESGWTEQWPTTDWRYYHYELRRCQRLEPGSYALVMTKPAEDPAEHFHAKLPSFDADVAGGEWIAVRIQPGGPWIRKDKKLAFGVYGYVP
jgi:hypothetical protein